jgi:C4-dicarboxylate-specific signal transduction histidine kinase
VSAYRRREVVFDALARGTPFTIASVADDIAVYAESEMLASAVGNLLHTRLKVEDRWGGLPDGAAERMLLPSDPTSNDRSGLGLGLDISRRSMKRTVAY